MKTLNQGQGLVIAVDGTDGSGKATQVECLVSSLSQQGYGVETMSFPRYKEGFSGKFLDEALHGKYGDFLHAHPYLASYPYAHDRLDAAPQIKVWRDQGKIVVLDRYQSVNIIHQGSKFDSLEGLTEYVNWLDTFEFGVNRIPRPDLVMILSVPAWVSQQLMRRRNEVRTVTMSDLEREEYFVRRDISEVDEAHQAKAERNIDRIFSIKPDWKRIECFDDGQLLSIEAVHQKVMECVKVNLNK